MASIVVSSSNLLRRDHFPRECARPRPRYTLHAAGQRRCRFNSRRRGGLSQGRRCEGAKPWLIMFGTGLASIGLQAVQARVTKWLGRSTNDHARLWDLQPQPNDLMLVLHRPLEPAPRKRTWRKVSIRSPRPRVVEDTRVRRGQVPLDFSNPSHPSEHAGRHDDGDWTDVGFPEEDRACCRDHVADR